MEKEEILEFETHLAAASSKANITEATSLLLKQVKCFEGNRIKLKQSLNAHHIFLYVIVDAFGSIWPS